MYLHFQPPPPFNLLLGILLKTAGVAGFPVAARMLFAVIGLSLAVCLDYVLRRLGYVDRVALGLSVAIVCLPQFLIYENYLFYPYLVSASLAWSVVFLDRYLQTFRRSHAVAFFSTVVVAILTWGFYHPLLLPALIAALVLYHRALGRPVSGVLTAAAAPTAILVLVCLKNFVVFGVAGTSSQSALNLSQSTVFALPIEIRQEAVRAAELSPLALRAGPFRPVDEVEQDLGREPISGIRALDERTRPSGAPNFNHAIYARASRAIASDLVWTFRHHPGTYLTSCRKALSIFFQPTYRYSHVPTMQDNLAVLAPLLWPVDLVHGLWAPKTPDASGVFQSIMRTGWLMAGLYAVVHVVFLWTLLRSGYAASDPLVTAMSYAWALSAYTIIVGVLVQPGENNRFRFSAEPLVLMLLLFVLSASGRRRE